MKVAYFVAHNGALPHAVIAAFLAAEPSGPGGQDILGQIENHEPADTIN